VGSDRRVGVIGIGSLGREHARIYASVGDIDSIFLYDRITERALETAEKHGVQTCGTIEELLDTCDIVSICTPATHHHETAMAAFERGVHTLIEKPIASTSREGEEMVRAAAGAGCILQVGHIERFNGAFEAATPLLKEPKFIEMHRLATFTPRGTDVSVVVDLMIHDIDLVLAVLPGDEIADLRASGAGVLTDSVDIVNARIAFSGGCVANVTASRISREPLRKIRFFQENLYVSVDLRRREIEAYERSEEFDSGDAGTDPINAIRRLDIRVDEGEPLRKEIESFLRTVREGGEPRVSGSEGLKALQVAEAILESIEGERSA
jgi:predicted dehydrogenase